MLQIVTALILILFLFKMVSSLVAIGKRIKQVQEDKITNRWEENEIIFISLGLILMLIFGYGMIKHSIVVFF